MISDEFKDVVLPVFPSSAMRANVLDASYDHQHAFSQTSFSSQEMVFNLQLSTPPDGLSPHGEDSRRNSNVSLEQMALPETDYFYYKPARPTLSVDVTPAAGEPLKTAPDSTPTSMEPMVFCEPVSQLQLLPSTPSQFFSPIEDSETAVACGEESCASCGFGSKKSSFQPNHAPLKFLLVDDNIINLKILARILLRIYPHLFIVQVQDLTNVMKLIGQERFDVVFLDIEMPYMSGTDIAAAIRSTPDLYAQLGLIAVTTKHLPCDLEEYGRLGIDFTLSKPLNYSYNYISACIESVMARRSTV